MSATLERCVRCEYDNKNKYLRCPKCSFPMMLVAGKYRLEKELAEGGMGNVYLAHHIRLDHNTERVIKVIKPKVFKKAGMNKRFRREVQVTAALSQRNKHIVRIYDDFGEEEGLGHYYVMEYLDGEPLTTSMEAEKRQTDKEILYIFYQMCLGMSSAHRRGVVHRDLKPDNIFLAKRGQNEYLVKIIDFGIALPEAATRITLGTLGTPLYMSPEQCDNDDMDGRSDIYAMAIILYEMLSGQYPYAATREHFRDFSLIMFLTAHIAKDPIPLSFHRPELSKLSDVLLKAMSKEPEHRFGTIEEFWNAIAASQPSDLQLPLLGPVTEDNLELANTLLPSDSEEVDIHRPTYESTLPYGAYGEEAALSPQLKSPPWLVTSMLVVLLAGISFLLWSVLSSPKKKQGKLQLPATSSRTTPPEIRRQIVRRAPTSHRVNTPAPSPLPKTIPERRVEPRPVRRVSRRKRSHREPRRVRRFRSQKQPRSLKSAGPCGAATASFRWVYTTVSKPRGKPVNLQFVDCSGCKSYPKAGGYCLRIPNSRSRATVEIYSKGYQRCTWTLRKKMTHLKWRLKESNLDALADPNYQCAAIVKE